MNEKELETLAKELWFIYETAKLDAPTTNVEWEIEMGNIKSAWLAVASALQLRDANIEQTAMYGSTGGKPLWPPREEWPDHR